MSSRPVKRKSLSSVSSDGDAGETEMRTTRQKKRRSDSSAEVLPASSSPKKRDSESLLPDKSEGIERIETSSIKKKTDVGSVVAAVGKKKGDSEDVLAIPSKEIGGDVSSVEDIGLKSSTTAGVSDTSTADPKGALLSSSAPTKPNIASQKTVGKSTFSAPKAEVAKDSDSGVVVPPVSLKEAATSDETSLVTPKKMDSDLDSRIKINMNPDPKAESSSVVLLKPKTEKTQEDPLTIQKEPGTPGTVPKKSSSPAKSLASNTDTKPSPPVRVKRKSGQETSPGESKAIKLVISPSATTEVKVKIDSSEPPLKKRVLEKPKFTIYGPSSEEELALKSSSAGDLKIHVEACQTVQAVLSESLSFKMDGLDSKETQLSSAVESVVGHFFLLKQKNRHDKFRLKARRDEVNAAKQSVDEKQLQLLNLLDEITHLRKEEQRCLKFKSADEDLHLVPLEDFLAAPDVDEEVKQLVRENKKASAHAIHVSRLQHELKQRKDIAASISETQKLVEKFEEEVVNIRSKLRNITPVAEEMFSIMEDVEVGLNLRVHERSEQIELVEYLPDPLFELYKSGIGVAALRDDGSLVVKIMGSLQETVKYLEVEQERKRRESREEQKNMEREESEEEEEEESGDGEDDEYDVGLKKKKKKGKHQHYHGSKKNDHQEEGNKTKTISETVFTPHPLHLSFEIQVRENSTTVLTFHCFPGLRNLITTQASIARSASIMNIPGDVINSNFPHLLASLYSPEDTGTVLSPSLFDVVTQEVLDEVLVKHREKGLPFGWAQDTTSAEGYIGDIETFLDKISRRVSSRIDLYEELSSIETCKAIIIPSFLRDEPDKHGVPPLSALLTRVQSFKRNTRSDFFSSVTMNKDRSLPIDEDPSMTTFYRVEFERASLPSRIIADVAVFDKYPTAAPYFFLSMQSDKDCSFNPILRQIERAINFKFPTDIHTAGPDVPVSFCLGRQIHYLMVCLESFVRAISSDIPITAAPLSKHGWIPLKYNPWARRFEH